MRGFLPSGVLYPGALFQGFLLSGFSYVQGSYVQGLLRFLVATFRGSCDGVFIHPGVLYSGVLTSSGS